MSSTPFSTTDFKDFLDLPELLFKWATSVLALSITFRNSIIGSHPVGLWMLNVAWLALASTCFAYLILRICVNVLVLSNQATHTRYSVIKSELDFSKQLGDDIIKSENLTNIEKADKLQQIHNESMAEITRLRSQKLEIDFDKITPLAPKCVIAEMIGFSIGVLFIVVFAILNNHANPISP